MSIDFYIRDVIGRGDEGSALLAARCAPTLKLSNYVDVLSEGMSGLSVLRLPRRYSVVVHSAAGDPEKTDMYEHAASLMDRLMDQARSINATPVGMANVIDARTGERETVMKAADALVERAERYKIPIMNGELAILGERVNCDANISGTMIGVVPRGSYGPIFCDNHVYCASFNPWGKAVYINSDGVGTKTEFYERANRYPRALSDSLAMKLDDAVKIGARPRVVFDVVETKGRIPCSLLQREATRLSGGQEMFTYLLHFEDVGDRLNGCGEGKRGEGERAFNVSGSVVSTIDEEAMRNPPTPKPGDYLLAIRGRPNPRSNGITDKRKTMVRVFGNDWHLSKEGRIFMEFLAEPSTIFYPVFSALLDNDEATGVYHMSGGAYNGKFARPLARLGLYTRLEDLFEPDWRELALGGFSCTPAEVAYSKWPMGNEGFVATPVPEKAMRRIKRHGLETRIVGRIEQSDRTGIELVGIKDSSGKDLYFSGK